jgi:Protein of unknown function (DUF3408).
MEKSKGKSRVVEDIDEAELLQSVYEQSNPATVNVLSKESEKQEKTVEPVSEQLKEKNRTKRVGQQEYESLFIRETDLPPARFGKSVYIRKDYHDRISQIISVIGVNEVSLFGYIDNVLTHHFENFGDEITQSFKKKIIFK